MFLLPLIAGACLPAAAGDASIGAGASPAETNPPSSGWADNRSYFTTCAEEDNINVPLYCPGLRRFTILAYHPSYCPCSYDGCPADFSGCNGGGGGDDGAPVICRPLWDDGRNVIEVCTLTDWWRPYSMDCTAGDQTQTGHFLRWYRRIAETDSWPQFFILYEDGSARLKPFPPSGIFDVCFGASVVIGPAPPAGRPFVDIQEVRVDPTSLSLEIHYRGGSMATITLSVERWEATAQVQLGYPTDEALPFATFRSMWVADDNCDTSIITCPVDASRILGDWDDFPGPCWGLERWLWSRHNTSAPDIHIRLDLQMCDMDRSGRVDGLDLAIFAPWFGSQASYHDFNGMADFDFNGVINGDDLAVFASCFGESL